MSCTNVNACPNEGTGDASNCSFERKLCVTCREDAGTVYVRMQSNNMPNHCFYISLGTLGEQNIDWEVKWMAQASNATASETRRNLAENRDL